MAIEVGMILEGKVSGITKFGAFVDLPDSKTGMVHISEVAPTFINEISDYVKVGQEVKVKVLALNDGKISLSMKQALPKEQQQQRKRSDRPQRQNHRSREPYKPAPPVTSPGDYEWQSSRRNAPSSFEDMMSKFKQTSEDKMSDLKRGGESRGYSRRGNGNGRKDKKLYKGGRFYENHHTQQEKSTSEITLRKDARKSFQSLIVFSRRMLLSM